MATYWYGNTVQSTWRSYAFYNTSSTNTAVTITVSGGFQSVGWGFDLDGVTCKVEIGSSSKSGTGNVSTATGETKNVRLVSDLKKTITRTHSAQTITLKTTINRSSASYMAGTSTGSTTVTVSALASYAVTYNANGGSGAPSSQTKWYGETLTLSSTRPTRTNYTFKGWATSASGGVSYASGASYTANAAVTLYAVWERAYTVPNAVTNLSLARNSDSQLVATWTNNSAVPREYTKLQINAQTDDGTWVQLSASLGASTVNYTWNGAQANHKYRVAVRPYNPAGWGSWAYSGYVYTTPAAPTSVTAEVPSAGTVNVTVTAGALWATSHEVEVTADGGETWSQVGTVAGAGGTYADTNPPAGTCQYRARAVIGTLYSDWAYSADIVTLCPPLAPTITQRPAAAIATGSTVTLGWLPNHPDGTPQTKAQVEVTAGGSTTTIAINDSTTTCDLTSYAATAQAVSVRVRTYGIYAAWGAWSDVVAFTAYVPPSVTVTSPASDGDVEQQLPVTITWSAVDATGISSQVLRLFDGDGRQLRSWQLDGSSRSFDLDRTSYFLTNGASYSVTLVVSAGSTLQATAARSFAIDYLGPAEPTADIVWDEDTLACAVTVGDGESPVAPTTILGVGAGTAVEVTDGTLHTLAVEGESVQDGTPTPSAPVAIQSVDSADVWVHGKNLLPHPAASVSVGKGVAFTDNGDGSYDAVGTANANAYIYITNNASNFELPAGTYTLSARDASGNIIPNVTVGASRWVNGVNTSYGNVTGNSKTFTHTGEGNVQIVVYVLSGKTVDTTIYPQLERGSTATAYEPYHSTLTPIDLQGHELRSLPDGTKDELHVDSAGNVTLTQRCEGTTQAVTDGVTGTVGVNVLSSTGQIADGPQVVYKLVTPQTISLGTIAMPTLADGDTVEVVGSSVVPSIGATWALPSEDGWATVHDGMTIGTDPVALTASTDYTLLVESEGAATLDVADEPMAQPFEDSTVSVSVGETRATLTTKADATNDLSMQFDVTGDARLRLALYPDGYAGAWHEYSSVARPQATEFYVVRVMPDGSEWLVADGLSSSQQAIDPLPPLGVGFSYRVVAVAASGVETPATFPALRETDSWAFGFGQGVAETLLLAANPSAQESWDHGGASYHFADGAGDGLPLWYGTDLLDVSHSWSFDIRPDEPDVAGDAARLFRSHAVAWVRDPLGHRWRAQVKASMTTKPGPRWAVSVSADELRFEEAS